MFECQSHFEVKMDLGSYGPKRPTRQPKESTALLMSVVRSILGSETNEHRDREKSKLEKEFKRSDQRLDELIATHHNDLGSVMQAFSKVSCRITASKDKIRLFKENLENCKMNLNCKRDELKKLWLEGIEHKQVMFLLHQIDNLKNAPEKVERYINSKHYLHATELLVNSVNVLQKDLEGVEALNEVKQSLKTTREKLYKTLIDDLHHHLYVRSVSNVYSSFQRQGSGRTGLLDSQLYNRKTADSDLKDLTPRSKKTDNVTPSKKHLDLSVANPTHKFDRLKPSGAPCSLCANEEQDKTHIVSEDLLLSDPEENSNHFIAILIECLCQLNRISETVEVIKGSIQKELYTIIRRTTPHVIETNESQENQPKLQLHLLELLFEQFYLISDVHECILHNLKHKARANNSTDVRMYNMADYWSKVQNVLQVILSEYLDIVNAATSSQLASSTFETTVDISSFFTKKKSARPKNSSLFKFDSSSHAISFNSYLKEQQAIYGSNEGLHTKDDGVHTEEKIYVCKPDAYNITVIFKPLIKFSEEIERALGYSEGAHCTLRTFITDFVKEAFLGRVRSEVITAIDSATKSMNGWRAHTDLNAQRKLNVTRPLLLNTVSVDRRIQELKNLMQDLPMNAESFLNMICNVLVVYKETCQAAYRGIVQPEAEDKRVISATWAKDEDISRFLRSLPNWINLQNVQSTGKAPDVEESSEEIRLRNKKESEILTGNLGDTLIPTHEILSDVTQLRILALVQESLEWFGGRVHQLASSLPTTELKMSPPSSPIKIMNIPPVSSVSVESLRQLAREFEDLAEICLLVLHLEVRLHCFYYLLPIAKQSSFASTTDIGQEPDPSIVHLNKDLSSIEEAMSSSLQPRKLKYIFEGLGHLVASIIINSAQYIKRINGNGVKKMCRNIFAIQQNLTNITLSREDALDHARRYYELLYHTPEEILNGVVENRPMFNELEYVNALQLLHRSQDKSSDVNSQLKQLQEILNKVSISI